jgi:hypothetical protein
MHERRAARRHWQSCSRGRRQEAGGRRQEAGGRRQEAGGRRQEAEGRRQSHWHSHATATISGHTVTQSSRQCVGSRNSTHVQLDDLQRVIYHTSMARSRAIVASAVVCTEQHHTSRHVICSSTDRPRTSFDRRSVATSTVSLSSASLSACQ